MIFALAFALAAGDPRIAVRAYDPARVTLLRGRVGIQSTIGFAPDERIENVAVGDSAAWQVTPNRRANLLFVKPVTARAHSNMTVVTDRRTYLFDLAASPRGPALYALNFTYAEPAVIAVPPPAAAPIVLTDVEKTPADLNFAWNGSGARKLLPLRSFDDGQSLYLSWPKDAAMPAILAVGADGKEGPVNYAMRGDYVVISGVPARLILRSGKDSAILVARAGAAPLRTAER
jgi:type IV secretion system protein VirB9